MHVSKVDQMNGTVTLQSGETIKAKTIVVCCGSITDQFYDKGTFTMVKSPQETYVVSDNSGLPGAMIIIGAPELNNHEMYMLLDGDNL